LAVISRIAKGEVYKSHATTQAGECRDLAGAGGGKLTYFTIPDTVFSVAIEARWIGGYRWLNADNPSIQVMHSFP